jgi:hypothetical protein
VLLRVADDGPQVAVRPAWTRPVSARGAEVSFLDTDKHEVLMIESLDCLDPESRAIAEAELDKRYLIPRITKVHRTEAHFGNRYWDVETDRGRTRFALREPHRNATWLGDDRVILRDTLGNRYEIHSFCELDAASRAQALKVI